MDAIYLRVSTKQQKLRAQVPTLKRWAKAQETKPKWYCDRYTGKTMDRKDFNRMMADIRSGLIKRVVVWKLDRLGRTVGGLLQLFDELKMFGCGFVSLSEGFDPFTPLGKLVLTILAAVAELERERIVERTIAGIEAKRDPKTLKCPWGGSKPGRRNVRTLAKEPAIRKLIASGATVSEIAKVLDVSRNTVMRERSKLNLNPVLEEQQA